MRIKQMPQRNVITSHLTLQALASAPRWVAYSGAPKGEGKIDKAPLSPKTGRLAYNDKPASWGTREAAEQRAKALRAEGHKPGVGIELGDLGDGTALCGVDLDGCHGTALDPWAQVICDRFQTYSEVSPSGEGVKLFFRVKTDDLPAIRKAMGTEHRKTWKLGDHEGMELHLSNSYYTVTGRAYGGHTDALRLAPAADLLWLVQTAPDAA
jgi:putative DNA primase/helicase